MPVGRKCRSLFVKGRTQYRILFPLAKQRERISIHPRFLAAPQENNKASVGRPRRRKICSRNKTLLIARTICRFHRETAHTRRIGDTCAVRRPDWNLTES